MRLADQYWCTRSGATGEQCVEHAKQLPIGMWRLTMRSLGMRALEQRRHLCPVRARDFRAEPLERIGFAQQLRAPMLHGMQARSLGIGRACPLSKPRFDGPRIDIAHQAADELHLAPSAFV